MKKPLNFLTLAVLLLLTSFSAFAQEEIEYKEYSYAELFKLIEDEKDSVYELKNAFIIFDPATDQGVTAQNAYDTTYIPSNPRIIDKHLVFRNVIFEYKQLEGGRFPSFYNITFKKKVEFHDPVSLNITKCTFENDIQIANIENHINFPNTIKNHSIVDRRIISLIGNEFKGGYRIHSYGNEGLELGEFYIQNNHFSKSFLENVPRGGWDALIVCRDTDNITEIINNTFKGTTNLGIFILASARIDFIENTFLETDLSLTLNTLDETSVLSFTDNKFKRVIQLSLDAFAPQHSLGYEQFKNGFIGGNYYRATQDLRNSYIDSVRIVNERQFKEEIAALSRFYTHYKQKFDTKSSNQVYTDIKNLETQRMEFEYREAPSFDTFFKWRINQFLKIYSAYGTQPQRAIVFSMYVILAFALVYLFFPNYWDSHGKSRLKHRFSFFYKYMSLNAGIQDVYLEENKAEIEDNEAFKSLLVAHKEQAPKLFFNLAMPLYRWSMAGTLTYAWLIKRFDFLKGTWKDTDAKTRGLKSFLIGTMFIIALLYDIFIKMLNALMLSINTFTTLGFGEIPIKGLPRYLAIIQGFIGWFMLTIFSVSLISQLLN